MLYLAVLAALVFVATLLGFVTPVLLWRWMHGRWPWETEGDRDRRAGREVRADHQQSDGP